jgi:transposase
MAMYSLDLRKRVMNAISKGMRPTIAAKTFDISRRVIYKWKDLFKETNSLEPKSGFQKGHSHKITNLEEFKDFAEKNGNQTVKMMITEWTKFKNQTVSESSMERALKKIGFTSKKNIQLRGSKPKEKRTIS